MLLHFYCIHFEIVHQECLEYHPLLLALVMYLLFVFLIVLYLGEILSVYNLLSFSYTGMIMKIVGVLPVCLFHRPLYPSVNYIFLIPCFPFPFNIFNWCTNSFFVYIFGFIYLFGNWIIVSVVEYL